MAHARHKFFDLHQANGSPLAAEARRRICGRYAIEAEMHGKSIEERARRRKEASQPRFAALKRWLQQNRKSTADSSAFAKAIREPLRRWAAFVRYARNRFYPIDSNTVEDAIRPIAPGKRNGLFAGSEAAERAAATQSLLETAHLNGIEAMAWLTDTLEKLPIWPNSRPDESLPLRTFSGRLSASCPRRGGSAGRLRKTGT